MGEVWHGVFYRDSKLVVGDNLKSVNTVAFSPDGEIVASGSVDETIKLWDVKTGECLATLEIPRPFAQSKITGIQGETEVETEAIKATLKALGAVE